MEYKPYTNLQPEPESEPIPETLQQETSTTPPVKFVHYKVEIGCGKDFDSHGEIGTITAAYQYFRGYLQVGFSFCSPKDNFNKKFGRKQAEERMYKYSNFIPVSMNLHYKVIREVISCFLELNLISGSATIYKIPQSWTQNSYIYK